MKRIIVLISPVIFLLFTACGGDDSAPPPAAACTNDESLKNLQCVSQIAQQICCNEQSASYSSYGAYCQAATTPTAGGYTLPPPPAPPTPTAQVPPQIPGCAPSTQPLTCNQAITNFELQYKTTYATCQTGSSEAWKQQQGAAVITCVGAQNGITTTEQYQNSPQAQCQAAYAYQGFATSAPQTVTGQIPAGAAPAAPPTMGTAPQARTNTVTTPNTTVPTEPTGTSGNGMAGLPTQPTGQGFTSNPQVTRLTAESIPAGF